jgi:hypothetical protein
MTGTAVIMLTTNINFSATFAIWFKEKENICINATNCYTAITYAQQQYRFPYLCIPHIH